MPEPDTSDTGTDTSAQNQEKDQQEMTTTSTRSSRKAVTTPKGKKGPRALTSAHKEALAVGREQGRIVRRYLEALDTYRPKRGRRRTRETIEARLNAITEALPSADALSRLTLLQERLNLTTDLESMEAGVDVADLEREFIKVAQEYGGRKDISYAVWREAGVDASVLKEAGITR